MGLWSKLGNAAKKGTKTVAGAAKNAAIDAAKNISPKKARTLSEKIIGKKGTDKIVKTGEKAHDTAEKVIGKKRLNAAKSGAKSATALAVVGGPKALIAAAVAGAVAGLVTEKDIVGDVAKTLFQDDGEDNQPEKSDKKAPENKDDKEGSPDLSEFDKKAAPEQPTPEAENKEEPTKPAVKPVAKKSRSPKR